MHLRPREVVAKRYKIGSSYTFLHLSHWRGLSSGHPVRQSVRIPVCQVHHLAPFIYLHSHRQPLGVFILAIQVSKLRSLSLVLDGGSGTSQVFLP